MSQERVKEALLLADETKYLLIGHHILNEVPSMLKEQFPGKKVIIIADKNTYPIAGNEVHTILQQHGLEAAEPFIISEPGLQADYRFVKEIISYLHSYEGIPLAVGSGVINDLTKRAAYELNRPYACIATAASMDGYSAYGASITKEGTKITMTCPAPQAILADLEIISQAPPLTTASGYADLFAKITAGADWILADALRIEPIEQQSWNIVQSGLGDALKDPQGARNGNREAIEHLTEGLMLGGFAIQSLKSSRPASGAEHQFSHLWDMEHHIFKGDEANQFGLYNELDEQAPSHGFKVGIGILTVSAIYEKLIQTPMDKIDVEKAVAGWKPLEQQISETLEMFQGTDFDTFAAGQVKDKYISPEELREQLLCLKNNWQTIKTNLQKQIIPRAEVKRRLELVGAPVNCESIGISKERLKRSCIRAQKIRNRFTVLDIALQTGYLEEWSEEISSL